MNRTTHNLVPGTPEWEQHRASCFNASDAAAMLDMSKYKSRAELLRETATGIRQEVSPETQRRFDDGHRFEAAARPLAERIIGEELFTPIMSVEIDGLRLSASFDGLTMDDSTAWEHKTSNKTLESHLSKGIIPVEYHPQLEQQLLVSGAERVLFMASNGTEETALHAWYESQPKLREQLISGWKQFAKDVKAYKPEEIVVAPVGKAPDALPALRVEVTGMVTASNLAEFKSVALSVIDAVNTDLQTDEDFANAEKAVKWCGDVEKRLAATKDAALAQTASIEELFRTMDAIAEEARTKRLYLDKLVKARKDSIRIEIQQAAVAEITAHVAEHNRAFGRNYLPMVQHDVAGAMKGKKTVSSLRDAAAAEVARAKIEADRIAAIIEANRFILGTRAAEHAFLFNDAATLVLKDPEAVSAIVDQRITAHEAEQRQKAESAAEAAREKIRREEQAKAQAEAQAKADAERREREQAEREASAKIEKFAEDFGGTGKVDVPESAPAPAAIAEVPKHAVAPKYTMPPTAQIVDAVAQRFVVPSHVAAAWLRSLNQAELAQVAA